MPEYCIADDLNAGQILIPVGKVHQLPWLCYFRASAIEHWHRHVQPPVLETIGRRRMICTTVGALRRWMGIPNILWQDLAILHQPLLPTREIIHLKWWPYSRTKGSCQQLISFWRRDPISPLPSAIRPYSSTTEAALKRYLQLSDAKGGRVVFEKNSEK